MARVSTVAPGVIPKPGPLPGTEPGAGILNVRLWYGKLRRFMWALAAVMAVAVVAYSVVEDVSPAESTVGIGGIVFKVQVADSEEEQTKGLSGTASLSADQGMLFDFGSDSYWGIWMKGMNYPIDIIWVDSYMQVVHIEHNVSPDTYPQAFTSDVPARYVIEIQGGQAAAQGLHEGQIANFKIQP